jgi:uncharacterized membrane protein YdjX (TVP38/TMEM64 family)
MLCMVCKEEGGREGGAWVSLVLMMAWLRVGAAASGAALTILTCGQSWGFMIAAFLLSIVTTFTTIAVAWLFYRPLARRSHSHPPPRPPGASKWAAVPR